MNKVAYYEQEIMEKIATRAWKKHYGELSEASQKKLVDSGVHNYKKELKGLEKGTKEILKKNNIKVRRNPVSRIIGAVESAIDVTKAQKDNPSTYGNPELVKNIKNYTQAILSQPNAATTSYHKGGGNVFYKSNIPHKTEKISRKIDKLRAPLFGKVDSGVSTKDLDNLDKKYISAVAKRHEADEIRAGKMKDNTFVDSIIGKIQKYRTAGGHLSPDVLTRESENIAIAPKKAKDFMTKLRTQTGEKGIWEVNGINYGKDAIADKKKVISMRKNVGRVNSSPNPFI